MSLLFRILKFIVCFESILFILFVILLKFIQASLVAIMEHLYSQISSWWSVRIGYTHFLFTKFDFFNHHFFLFIHIIFNVFIDLVMLSCIMFSEFVEFSLSFFSNRLNPILFLQILNLNFFDLIKGIFQFKLFFSCHFLFYLFKSFKRLSGFTYLMFYMSFLVFFSSGHLLVYILF